MGRSTLLGWAGAAWLLAAAWAQAAPDSTEPPVATRQRGFTIPFRIATPSTSSHSPVEVQLHYRPEGEGNWALYERVDLRAEPDRREFSFRAPYDGAFSFFVRTLDAQGALRPESPPRPELTVVVDTVEPRLDLKAVRGASGEVQAEWRIEEPNLDPSTLRVEYQLPGEVNWRPVVVPPPGKEGSEPHYFGRTTWWPPVESGVISVRAEVRDWAGNRALNQATLSLNAAAGSASDVAAWRGASADTPAATPAEQRYEQRYAQPPTQPYTQSAAPSTSTGSVAWPADQTTSTPLAGQGRDDLAARHGAGGSMHSRDPSGHGAPTDYRRDGAGGFYQASVARPGPAGDERVARTIVDTAEPPYESRVATTRGGGPSSPAYERLPMGERPRMVNSKRFELDYDIESVGPSGVAKVQLWGSSDGGRTWSDFGIDPDNRSPFVVNVPGEGLYGFRMVVESGTGLRGEPPRSGEQPEVWVGVDLAQPTAELISAEQGVGAEAGTLIVTWFADDAHLSPRPVSLLFTDAPGGVWSQIVSGLENSGRYAWPLDNRVPDSIYLRLEVRDESGNVAAVESDRPVPLDRVRPQGRIRNVRPVDDSARRPVRYRFY